MKKDDTKLKNFLEEVREKISDFLLKYFDHVSFTEYFFKTRTEVVDNKLIVLINISPTKHVGGDKTITIARLTVEISETGTSKELTVSRHFLEFSSLINLFDIKHRSTLEGVLKLITIMIGIIIEGFVIKK